MPNALKVRFILHRALQCAVHVPHFKHVEYVSLSYLQEMTIGRVSSCYDFQCHTFLHLMPHLHLILFQCLNAFGDLHLSDNATNEGAKWSGELLCSSTRQDIIIARRLRVIVEVDQLHTVSGSRRRVKWQRLQAREFEETHSSSCRPLLHFTTAVQLQIQA